MNPALACVVLRRYSTHVLCGSSYFLVPSSMYCHIYYMYNEACIKIWLHERPPVLKDDTFIIIISRRN